MIKKIKKFIETDIAELPLAIILTLICVFSMVTLTGLAMLAILLGKLVYLFYMMVW
jgi:hypothetical protein